MQLIRPGPKILDAEVHSVNYSERYCKVTWQRYVCIIHSDTLASESHFRQSVIEIGKMLLQFLLFLMRT